MQLTLGILAGAAAGFVLGVMLAPKKGSDFRKDINSSLDDLTSKVSDLFSEGRDKLSRVARLKRTVEEDVREGLGSAAKKAAL